MRPLEMRGPAAGGEEAWRGRRDLARTQRDRLAQARPAAGSGVIDASLTLARCAAAIDARPDVVDGLRHAAAWSAAAFLAADAGRAVAVAGNAGHEVAPHPPALPPLALGGLCGAMLLRDAQALAVVAAPGAFERNCSRIAAGSVVVGHEAFWPLYGGLFAAVARGAPVEESSIQACRAAILTDKTSAIDRAGLRALKLPPLSLIEALSAYEAQSFAAALADAVSAFEAFFNQPDWVTLDAGMLALDISALCAVAHDRHGAPADCGSPFVPDWLVAGAIGAS